MPKIPRLVDDGARVPLLHRCSGDAGVTLALGHHTTLTAESGAASEALMITFCAWYWAAFSKREKSDR